MADDLTGPGFDTRSVPEEHLAAIDARALELLAQWHRHPAVAPWAEVGGVKLGEVVEYDLIEALIAAMMEDAPE